MQQEQMPHTSAVTAVANLQINGVLKYIKPNNEYIHKERTTQNSTRKYRQNNTRHKLQYNKV